MPADRRADEALEYLARLARFGMRLGLRRMEAILQRLGHPERRFGVVHVAGTNGKGSTAAMVAAAAREAGLRTGLYTSPHLVRFNERIVVDGAPVADEALADAYRAVRAAVEEIAPEEPPTQFEFATAMALWLFARAGVELAVLEVGLGGRLDATNVVHPQVCVITPLGLDHTDVLGPTLAHIAAEKAGIVKPGADVVTACQPPEAAGVIRAKAREAGASLLEVAGPGAPAEEQAYRYVPRRADLRGGALDLLLPGGERIEGLEVGLLGPHQLQNAALAAAALHRLALRGWPTGWEAVRRGLTGVSWPARLQVVARRPWVILDGAHNPAAAAALADALRELFGRLPRLLVVGLLKEKDAAGVLGALVSPGATVVATRARSARTEPAAPEQLAELALKLGAARAEAVVPAAAALRRALEKAAPGDVVLVAGSLYLAGELLAELGSALPALSARPRP